VSACFVCKFYCQQWQKNNHINKKSEEANMKYSIKEVIRLLREIESLMESDIFYNLEWEEYNDEQLKIEGIASQAELLTALDEAMTHLNDIAPYEKENLFKGGK